MAVVTVLLVVPLTIGVWLWLSMRSLNKSRPSYKSRKSARPSQTFSKIPVEKDKNTDVSKLITELSEQQKREEEQTSNNNVTPAQRADAPQSGADNSSLLSLNDNNGAITIRDHILDANDETLRRFFKEYAGFARELIEDKRQRIKNGEISDDYCFSMRMMNDYTGDEWKLMEVMHSLTESNILSFSEQELKKLSVGQLNIVQGWLSLENSVKYRVRKIAEEKNRGDIKFGKTSIKKLKNQYEKLADLWNAILNDDVMTPEELRMLSEKIHSYRIYSSDFNDFENYVYNDVLKKGSIDSIAAKRIYDYVVAILNIFKERIAFKIKQEEDHIKEETGGNQETEAVAKT